MVNMQVRVSFLNVLLLIKGIKLIRFWDVVPIDHLLARLAIDSDNVAKRITALLVHSYFPLNKVHPAPFIL